MGEHLKVHYLIVGGGVAAAQASVGVREVDEEGSVLIVCRENRYPYDRPPLSKGFLTKDLSPEDIESKDPSFYEEKKISVRKGVEVTSIDAGAKTAQLPDGSSVTYEKALLATGSSAVEPKIPGIDLKGVHLLRSVDDALAIKSLMHEGKSAVMVGAGYIGMEVGSQCLSQGMKVALLDPAPQPWGRFASPETGAYLKAYFEEKGATMAMGDSAAELVGSGIVSSVKTKGGKDLPADLVVVGVGIRQNLDLAKTAGVTMHEEGVLADRQLRTSDPNIFVAGDIAAFDDAVLGRVWHADHYLNGKWQGKQAGRNMAGANEDYVRVPYFYSDILDLGMILRGDPREVSSAKLLGSRQDSHFVELYARADGTLGMGLAITRDGAKLDEFADKLEPLIEQRRKAADISEADLGF